MKNTFTVSKTLCKKLAAACACLAFVNTSFAQTNMESYFSGASLAKGYKKLTNHNPMYTQRYGADPCAMIYDDEVFIYMTNDQQEFDVHPNQDNSYGNINTINCISSKDLVNWTDHGVMKVAKRGSGPASWASCSWAPTACHKVVDGKEKFFLYFANNGSGIGVVTSDCPWGPWKDPIGKELISRNTPNCSNVTWLFDPAVLVDDDGTAYVYFGGGVPNGKQADPGTGRVAKLNSDFISVNGTPATINPPYLFEDAGVNKIAGKYVYSYCSNWNCTGNPMSNAQICYMTSSNPMGPFTYAGIAYNNQADFLNGEYGNNGGNNHHSMFEFKGKWYMTYHARVLQNARGEKGDYRSSHVDYVNVNTQNGSITKSSGSAKGVDQVGYLNPFDKTEAETMAWMGGIDTKVGGSNMLVTSIDKGDWIGLAGVDFGAGASVFSACVSSTKTGAIKICKGKPDGDVLGYLEVPNTNGQLQEVTVTLNKAISGVSDLFFVFSGGFEFDYWMFKKADVSLTVSESDVEAPATISLSVKTSEEGITKADYYLGDQLIGSETTAPYTFKYDIPEPGKYEFHAILTNNAGKTFESPVATVSARLAQGPYDGVAQELPGRLEVERYDVGGAGYAYEDSDDLNEGKVFRTDEGVDLDTDGGDGYVLGWTKKGEWVEYTIDVKYTDTYTWTAKVASGVANSSFNLSIDGKDIAGGSITVPQGEDWTTYTTIEGKTSELAEGKHVLKLTIENDYVNIDYIDFKAVSDHPTVGIENINNKAIVNGEFEIFSMSGVLLDVFQINASTIEEALESRNFASGSYVARQKGEDKSEIVIVK